MREWAAELAAQLVERGAPFSNGSSGLHCIDSKRAFLSLPHFSEDATRSIGLGRIDWAQALIEISCNFAHVAEVLGKALLQHGQRRKP